MQRKGRMPAPRTFMGFQHTHTHTRFDERQPDFAPLSKSNFIQGPSTTPACRGSRALGDDFCDLTTTADKRPH